MKKIFQSVVVAAAFAFFLVPVADATVGASCTAAAKTGICRADALDCTATEDPSGPGSCTGATEECCTPKTAGGGGGGTIQFSNPLSFTTVQGATQSLLNALQGIIVTLALVFLVLGGVLYVISGGNDKQITTAKAAITAAMIGLAIGIAAPSFLKEIADVLGWGMTCDANGDGVATAAECPGAGALSLGAILGNVLNFLLSMVGILAIIMLVIGGLMYFAAAGDEKRADTAKSIVKFAIIGIAVSLAALVIVTQIAKFF